MQTILRKRVLRDLKENLFRYLALGILILVSMYLIVSMLGAAETIIQGGEYFEKQQNVEAGQFTVFVPLNKTQIGELKRKGVQLENTFYMDFPVKDDSTLRIFKDRTSIDKVYVEKGHKAHKSNELVLEKRYCETKKLQVGDTIQIADKSFTVTGIGCAPDYNSTLKSISDSTVDSKQFGVAFLTSEGYQSLLDSGKSAKTEEYVYAYRLSRGMTDKKLKEILNEYKVDASDINDTYFQEYWKHTGKKKDDLQDGIKKLNDGAVTLRNGLSKLSDHKDDLQKGASQVFDAYLQQASDALQEYGLQGTLTEDNYRTKLENMYQKSDNALFRLELSSVKEQLIGLQAYKDGVDEYTEGVSKASKGAGKLQKGTNKLKNKTDDIIDEYFSFDLSNLTQFLKASDNPRISAAAEDQVINKYAGLVAGVIIIILFAYVISVFVVHGIERESSVIGALYALGVKRNDLLRHYLTLPVCVTMLFSVLGTVIGYSPIGVQTQMADSYAYFSIKQMSPVYAPYILVYALVMPGVMAAIVNWFVIRGKLSRPVLSLMRKEAKELPVRKVQIHRLGFVGTFRLRQMLRELRTGLTVVFGLFICMLITMLALDCYVMCENVNVESRRDTKFSYMYTYKYPDEKVPAHGTPGFAKSLKREMYGNNLDVTLLGITKDNPYFDAKVTKSANRVILSSAAAEKYQLGKGDKIILTDEEEERDYAFTVDGVTNYSAGLYVFMNIDSMRELFGQEDTYFNVVFSDRELSIPSGKLYSILSRQEIEKSSEIFVKMMMNMIYTLLIVSAVIFCVVMYLMMKVMIDRSAFGISLVKIFGYRMKEIRKLYLNGNFYVIAVGTAVCIPLAKVVMDAMYPLMVSNVASGCNIHFGWQIYVGLYVCVIALYFVINHFLVRHLQKIEPAEVLKNRE